ncbi:hypothetical protein OA90_25485 [Labrenzia sp. OB1]|nr:hypothetical protein OA90_25485 [Labrenzia sp. OB1]
MTLSGPCEAPRHGGIEPRILTAYRGGEIGAELAGHHILNVAALAHIADFGDVIPIRTRGREDHTVEQRHAGTQNAGRVFEERVEFLNKLP